MPRGSWWMKQNTHLLAQVAISAGRGASSSTPRSAPARRTRRSARGRPCALDAQRQAIVGAVELEVDRVAQGLRR